VTAYLENKQKRNEQIKILVDIVCNFFTSEEWQAEQELTESILLSPLLPLLESAFRNGSWLDMAKEAPLYHSYMGKSIMFIISFSIDKSFSQLEELGWLSYRD
jgi:hypothetical protein